MTTNNLKENDIDTTPIQLQEGCTGNCLWEVCGGAYTGCGVGGWMNGDGDASISSDCSNARFQAPC
jgi:hypothetical protein